MTVAARAGAPSESDVQQFLAFAGRAAASNII
jgi:hypothetical protein